MFLLLLPKTTAKYSQMTTLAQKMHLDFTFMTEQLS